MTAALRDHGLIETFAPYADTIEHLVNTDRYFRALLALNVLIWREIQSIVSGAMPASDAYLASLEEQRQAILFDVARLADIPVNLIASPSTGLAA